MSIAESLRQRRYADSMGLAIGACVGLVILVAVIAAYRLAYRDDAANTVAAVTPPKAESQQQSRDQSEAAKLAAPKEKSDEELDREAFITFVKAHAANPAELEIMSFGKRTKDFRLIVFRCTQVDVSADSWHPETGRRTRAGTTVAMDDAWVDFSGHDVLKVWLVRCGRQWD
jgi:hypothetical protein